MVTPGPGELAKKEKKRRKYTPGLASLRFIPTYLSPAEAQRLYEEQSVGEIPLDTICFDDCISGMDRMPSNSVDLVIADPPFGLGFSGKEAQYNRDKDRLFAILSG